MDTPTQGSTRERPSTTTESGCGCCTTTSAVAIAIAQASAYAAAVAKNLVRIGILIAIVIAIGVIVQAIAFAFAAASATATAIAIAVAVAIAIAVAVALAAVLPIIPLFRRVVPQCSVVLDVPPTASLSAPLRPAVVFETLDPLARADHVDVLQSTDGGASFTPLTISAGNPATNLPPTGSFIWDGVSAFSPGALILVRAVAFDGNDVELCRSQIRPLRVQS